MTDIAAEGQPPPKRRAAFVFILVTVLLDSVALGMVVPVLPQIVLGFAGGNAASAAHIVGIIATVWAAMQFVTMPIAGALSDRFGRRPIVLASNVGMGLSYLVIAAAPNLAWILVGRVLSGIASASVSTANAYIADTTPPDQRAASFGLLGATFGAGFVIGPALGGLFGAIDARLPFYVAAGFSLANALYGMFVLPESLPADKRTPFRWRAANPIGSLAFLNAQPKVRLFAAARFLEGLAQFVLPSTFVLYAGHRYGWSTGTIGLTLAVVGAAAMVVNALLVRRIVKAIGERHALLLGMGCAVAAYLIYGLAPTGEIFWLGIPIASLGAISVAAMQAIVTRQVAMGEQGQLQGALSGLLGLAGMIGPLVFTAVFAAGIDGAFGFEAPGAALLLAASLVACAWFIARAATHKLD